MKPWIISVSRPGKTWGSPRAVKQLGWMTTKASGFCWKTGFKLSYFIQILYDYIKQTFKYKLIVAKLIVKDSHTI